MATITDTIKSKPRVPGNKSIARRLRASGWVPAIAYGPSKEPTPLAIDPKIFVAARLEYGVAHVYDVEVEGGTDFKAIIKSVDRDPVNRQLHHIDFFAVDMDQPIHIQVRIDLVGKCVGVVNGGVVQQTRRRVDVTCLPGDVPPHIDLDISELDIGASLHLSDVPFPEGVTSNAVENLTIAVCLSKGGKEEDTDVVAVEGEEEDGETKS